METIHLDEKYGARVEEIDKELEQQRQSCERIRKELQRLGQMEIKERIKYLPEKTGEKLKQELEKRNPTPIEKLDLRTVNDSYPFNVKPNDYWKTKEETSNYRVGGDETEVPEQYDLHQSDVDDVTNWKEIADSLDDSSLTDLTKIFNL